MVEFALTVPIFLLLLLGVFEFGRMMFTYTSITNGIREVARRASIPTATSDYIVSGFNETAFIMGSIKSGDLVCIYVDSTGTASPSVSTMCNDTDPAEECPLPMSAATCTVPSRTNLSRGAVIVYVNYVFEFTPFFETFLARARAATSSDLSFNLTSTTRGFIE